MIVWIRTVGSYESYPYTTNTYIVECNGDVSMSDLGNLLLEDIDHFILGEDEMEAQGDDDRMLFAR